MSLVLCVLLLLRSGGAGEAPDQIWPLCVAYSDRVFIDLNPEDGRATARLLVESMAHEEGIASDVSVVIYDDIETLRAGLEAEVIDVATMVTHEYLALESSGLLEPAFVPDFGDRITESSVLVVRTDARFDDLPDLAGGHLMVSRSLRHELPLEWMDSELHSVGLPSSSELFAVVKETRGAGPALMAVFFGQADACIVLGSSLRSAVELNPQLGSQLRVMRESPGVVASLICLRSNLPEDKRRLILEPLSRLDKSPYGRQLLTIFRVGGLLPYRPEYLTETRRYFATFLAAGDSS